MRLYTNLFSNLGHLQFTIDDFQKQLFHNVQLKIKTKFSQAIGNRQINMLLFFQKGPFKSIDTSQKYNDFINNILIAQNINNCQVLCLVQPINQKQNKQQGKNCYIQAQNVQNIQEKNKCSQTIYQAHQYQDHQKGKQKNQYQSQKIILKQQPEKPPSQNNEQARSRSTHQIRSYHSVGSIESLQTNMQDINQDINDSDKQEQNNINDNQKQISDAQQFLALNDNLKQTFSQAQLQDQLHDNSFTQNDNDNIAIMEASLNFRRFQGFVNWICQETRPPDNQWIKVQLFQFFEKIDQMEMQDQDQEEINQQLDQMQDLINCSEQQQQEFQFMTFQEYQKTKLCLSQFNS